jgi:hypothetical protein
MKLRHHLKSRALGNELGIVSGSVYTPDLHIVTLKVKERNFQ